MENIKLFLIFTRFQSNAHAFALRCRIELENNSDSAFTAFTQPPCAENSYFFVSLEVGTMEPKKSKSCSRVSVDFKGCPIRPSIQQIDKLLKGEMQLDFKQCTVIQMHHIRNCVLITFSGGKEIAEEFAKRNNCRYSIVHETGKYSIPVHVDDGAIEVRVCDLPIHFEQSKVRQQMETYGEVISARMEKWQNYFGGTYSGVRILRMHLKRPIPSYAKFEFETDNGFESCVSRVAYPGQVATCQFCDKDVHFKISCIEAAKRNTTPTLTKNQMKPSQINVKQTPPTNQPNNDTQPGTSNTIPADTPATPSIAETETPTPETEPQGDAIQPPAGQFHTVTYKQKKTSKQITSHTTDNSEEDNSKPHEDIPEDAAAEVASPPRKKMVTRASNRQQ